jgi:capsular polysaccharide biosynthesis protein
MSSEENKNTTKGNEDEIDLIALARTLWEGRRTVIKTMFIFTVLGFIIAIFSPKEYTATTTMVPQVNNPSAKMGGLSSLASLAGFNLDMNMGGNEISPMLYPQILSSISFQLEIMNAKYKFEELEKEISLYDYYLNYYKPGLFSALKKYTIGLPGVILRAIRGTEEEKPIKQESEIIRISKEQDEIRKKIEERLILNVNDKDGYITLSSHFHQAELSAQVAQKAQKQLQEYITQFRIEKAASQLSFIEDRYNETRIEFVKAQKKLALYRDANKNITSATARTEEERLENEYQLAFEVYSELAKQLEQARIQVKEDTPAFSIIERVYIPLKKIKPQRVLILVLWIIIGLFMGIGVIGSKIFLHSLRKQWQNNYHE